MALFRENRGLQAGDLLSETLEFVTSKGHRWVEKRSWKSQEVAFFARNRKLASGSIFKAPPYKRKQGRYPAKLSSQWVLIDDKNNYLSWAEAHWYSGAINRYFLILGNLPQEGELFEQSLSLLISSMFVAGKIDVLEIVTVSDLDQKIVMQLTECPPITGCMFESHGEAIYSDLTGKDVVIFRVSAARWWQSSGGKRHKKSTAYLDYKAKKVQSKYQEEHPEHSKSKRRSLIFQMVSGFMGRKKTS